MSEEFYFKPSTEEFKAQFKAFAFSDDENNIDNQSPNIIDIGYLDNILFNITLEVKKIINDNGYELPTAENKLPAFSIKQYIMFAAAEVFTSVYASNSDLINYIREKSKEYKEQFINDFGSKAAGDRSYSNISLYGDAPKQ